jgi:8-oxo-dGTP diphosphatase
MADLLQVAAAAIFDGAGRVLIARRPVAVHQGGLWEFPGGKLEPGETPEAALIRELDEELGIRPTRYRRLIRIPHHYPDRSVLLDVWRVDAFAGEPEGRQGQPVRWVTPDDLPQFTFPAANQPIVSAGRLPEHYVITPDCSDPAGFLAALAAVVQQGAELVQLRCPSLSDHEYRELARPAVTVCRSAGARILLNADPTLALELGADGVHLNSQRLRALNARPVDEALLLGASCHDADELAKARVVGADFAVLSPVMPTASHGDAQPLGWARFRQLVADVPLPVYALGGVGPADLATAQAARAQGVAGISAFWPQ